MGMNLKKLTGAVESAGLSKKQAQTAVKTLLDALGAELKKNEKVNLAGFGSFVVKERKARIGRNPKTGARITIPPKRTVIFKPAKSLLAEMESAYQQVVKLKVYCQDKMISEHNMWKSMICIGRDKQNDIQLTDDINASRRHARIEQVGRSLIVTDLGSTNGILVNGKKVASRELYDNDKVKIGDHLIVCRIEYKKVEPEEQARAGTDDMTVLMEAMPGKCGGREDSAVKGDTAQ